MDHQPPRWIPTFYVLIPGESLLPSIPTLCNLTFGMFHFDVDFLNSTKESQHDLPSQAPPKEEMASSFSWTSLSRVPHQELYVWVILHLPRLNQVISAPKDIVNKYLLTGSCQCVKLSFVPPSPFFFVTLVFGLEPYFCSHQGQTLTRLPP